MNRFILFLLILVMATTVSANTVSNFSSRSFGSFYLASLDSIDKDEIVNKNYLTFVGDILLARKVERLMLLNGKNYPFERLDLNDDNGYLLGNFEASIPTTHIPTRDYNFAFSVSSSSLETLLKNKFTHLSLANNHSYDFGIEGYLNTQLTLNNIKISTFGDQNKLSTTSISYIQISNEIYSLIAINAVNLEINISDLDKVINEANKNSTKQIVYIHWGEEYQLRHNQAQEVLAKKIVELGGDLIIGHHPHVVQDVSLIDGVLVFYSLGNFVFDQYFDKEVQQGLLIKLSKAEDKGKINLVPITSEDRLSSPRKMTLNEQDIFLKRLAERSDIQLRDQILKGEFKF